MRSNHAKNTLLTVAATIAVVASSSLPAVAVNCPPGEIPRDDGFGCEPAPVRVPEPTSILGIIAVGGLIGKKAFDAQKVCK
ncbi:PEP-CTERM sorting domain-containing protein [Okeania sp. KiyG1]|uniref:PEP-CTERM sorting domain-containing protein n=1 Tax=Okeania sp. KiyG1 TaxID=2720165 RepID=UPI0019224846|nr:PEP-CTERM sorting domain-containing protein [Okeania sp. KiyG1]